jgi:hypothetical protein
MIWIYSNPDTGEDGLKVEPAEDPDTGEVTLEAVYAPCLERIFLLDA